MPSQENLAANQLATDRVGRYLEGKQAEEVLELLKNDAKELMIIMRYT